MFIRNKVPSDMTAAQYEPYINDRYSGGALSAAVLDAYPDHGKFLKVIKDVDPKGTFSNDFAKEIFADCDAAGCAANKPVIYPNTHSQSVGTGQVEADIAACKQLAESAGASPYGGNASDSARAAVHGGAVGAATGAGVVGVDPGRGDGPAERGRLSR